MGLLWHIDIVISGFDCKQGNVRGLSGATLHLLKRRLTWAAGLEVQARMYITVAYACGLASEKM